MTKEPKIPRLIVSLADFLADWDIFLLHQQKFKKIIKKIDFFKSINNNYSLISTLSYCFKINFEKLFEILHATVMFVFIKSSSKVMFFAPQLIFYWFFYLVKCQCSVIFMAWMKALSFMIVINESKVFRRICVLNFKILNRKGSL